MVMLKIDLNFGQKLFVTSDTHYNHKNICRGVTNWRTADGEIPISQTRDFKNLDHMNDAIVNKINEVIGQDDILIHLGDWSFGGFESIKEFRDRLICKNIYLIYGNHDCFDVENTEILTEDGWMKYDLWESLKPKIASYNINNGEISFNSPLEKYVSNYKGEMYHLKNRLVDIFVTPNHRMFLSQKSHSNKDFKFIKIKDIPETKSTLEILNSGINSKSDLGINENILALSAWILADGSVKEGMYGLSYTIYQSEGKHTIVENLLDSLNISYRKTVRDRKITKIIDKDLKSCKVSYEYNINHGSILENYIKAKYSLPSWLFRLSKKEFMVFLENYVLADGNKHKQNTNTSWVIYGTSKELSTIQALCVINGIRATLNIYNQKQYRLYITLSQHSSEVSRYSDSLKKVDFNGRIFCFKTVDDTLVIRRNGKVSIIGNSHIENNRQGIQGIFTKTMQYTTLRVKFPSHGKIIGGSYEFVLMHYPIASHHNMNNGVIHLHGHVHLPSHHKIGKGKSLDVGVDGNDLYPYNIKDVIELMKNQPIRKLELPSDHHEERLENSK
jgi:calcineurin-like phosphoesterase family protein